MPVKISLPLDKHAWRPSPLLGQIVLVTTLNADGQSNVAPKSWITMVSFDPPRLALGCNMQHWTAQNILRSGEFVINVIDAEQVEMAWNAHSFPHPRPVERLGLTPIMAIAIQPPRIAECKAHLECRLEQHLAYNQELLFIARILAVSIDQQAFDQSDSYAYLRLPVFLEGSAFGVIENSRKIKEG